jgi:hypothetical protein
VIPLDKAMTTKALYASFKILNLKFNLLLKSQGVNAKITLMTNFLEQRFDLYKQNSPKEHFVYISIDNIVYAARSMFELCQPIGKRDWKKRSACRNQAIIIPTKL